MIPFGGKTYFNKSLQVIISLSARLILVLPGMHNIPKMGQILSAENWPVGLTLSKWLGLHVCRDSLWVSAQEKLSPSQYLLIFLEVQLHSCPGIPMAALNFYNQLLFPLMVSFAWKKIILNYNMGLWEDDSINWNSDVLQQTDTKCQCDGSRQCSFEKQSKTKMLLA